MAEGDEGRKITRYILLGSFLGGLVGTTIAIFAFPQSAEEKKKQVQEIQKEFLKPVKVKVIELIENVADTLRKSIEEAAKKPESGEREIT